jgi:triphosphoribosyl-dephospho-CoA synthase
MSDTGKAGEHDPSAPLSPAFVSTAAQLACLIEATAPKPGNVSPGRHFKDMRYEHFLASAAAIGPVMAEAGERPIGATVLGAARATRRWTRANTNLGIAMLFAPLARTALAGSSGPLRDRLSVELRASTLQDARDVYAAIRLMSPGGLGRVSAQDVSSEPTATLRDVMAMAADHDAVAHEYTTDYSRIFDGGMLALTRARSDGLGWVDATVETYLQLLAAGVDTLIARKQGMPAALEVSRRARAVAVAGGVRSAEGRTALEAFDQSLRDPDNANNPGATADLTAAVLFVAFLMGGWDGGGR